MASVQIPFSEADKQVVRSLNGWMMFIAILHIIGAIIIMLLGCLATFGSLTMFAISPLMGALSLLNMAILLALGCIIGAEGFLAIQARSALDSMLVTGSQDQAAEAFRRLKLFFTLELVVFGVSLVMQLLSLAQAAVMPSVMGGGL